MHIFKNGIVNKNIGKFYQKMSKTEIVINLLC